MTTTKGSIKTTKDGVIDEQMLMTYSEEEKQQNKENKENSKLVFSPEFIPYYPTVKKTLGLSHTETLLYGFIRFYLSNAKTGAEFWFTNEQLGEILDISDWTISQGIKKLSSIGLVKCSYKVKSGGGRSRRLIFQGSEHWITQCPNIAKPNVRTLQNPTEIEKDTIEKDLIEKRNGLKKLRAKLTTMGILR